MTSRCSTADRSTPPESRAAVVVRLEPTISGAKVAQGRRTSRMQDAMRGLDHVAVSREVIRRRRSAVMPLLLVEHGDVEAVSVVERVAA